jgi:WD repeat-containing protein 19
VRAKLKTQNTTELERKLATPVHHCEENPKNSNNQIKMKLLFQVEGQDLGSGQTPQFAWHPDGSYLAAIGSNRVLHIYDRRGVLLDSFALDGPCFSLAWADDGSALAAACLGTPAVSVWDSNTRKLAKVDMSLKAERDITYVGWSPGGAVLAAATAKGNLVLMNRRTSKKDAIVGKHTRRITCGCWSADGRLALGAEDKQASLCFSCRFFCIIAGADV